MVVIDVLFEASIVSDRFRNSKRSSMRVCREFLHKCLQCAILGSFCCGGSLTSSQLIRAQTGKFYILMCGPNLIPDYVKF